MKISRFDGPSVHAILDECHAALAPIAEKYGLTLDRKGRTYQREALPVMFQFLIAKTDADGVTLDAQGMDFQRYAQTFDLEPSDLGREFNVPEGKRFRICGLNVRSPKYPVMAEEVRTGKKFKFSVERVKLFLKG
jgi:hypothetical protein